MKLTDPVKDIRRRYVEAFGLPSGNPNDPLWEDTLRAWTQRFIQQVVHERPSENWGWKSAGGGRPPSKDSLARQIDGRLWSWDLLIGAGTGTPTLAEDPDGHDITGQVFIQVVGVNVFGVSHPVPAPPPAPAPAPTPPAGATGSGEPPGPPVLVVDDATRAMIATVVERLAAVESQIARLEEANERRYQDLVKRIQHSV
ncbi:MAG: hypothetical protein AB7N65_15050 [Vicinamibacterales bacterium]